MAALDKKLFKTWTTRFRSAITQGRSGGISMWMGCWAPLLRKVFLAWSTRLATSVGTGVTDNVPISMRPASSRSLSNAFIWSACSSMMRKNCCTTARSRGGEAPIAVVADPLMEANGARSSWLTMPRNSARKRSNSSMGAKSCTVMTMDSIVPSLEWIGAAFINVVTLRPSGTWSTVSLARIFEASLNTWTTECSSSEITHPSGRRNVIISSSSSTGWPGVTNPWRIRFISWLYETGLPDLASKTATPTGEMSTKASRSARTRCSF